MFRRRDKHHNPIASRGHSPPSHAGWHPTGIKQILAEGAANRGRRNALGEPLVLPAPSPCWARVFPVVEHQAIVVEDQSASLFQFHLPFCWLSKERFQKVMTSASPSG